jgi:hypothetical protein
MYQDLVRPAHRYIFGCRFLFHRSLVHFHKVRLYPAHSYILACNPYHYKAVNRSLFIGLIFTIEHTGETRLGDTAYIRLGKFNLHFYSSSGTVIGKVCLDSQYICCLRQPVLYFEAVPLHLDLPALLQTNLLALEPIFAPLAPPFRLLMLEYKFHLCY